MTLTMCSMGSGLLNTLGLSSSGILLVCIPFVLTYAMATAMECSIHPYDILECEPEIVSGYYVDYGGVSFMVIYLGEGIATPTTMMDTACYVVVCC